MGAVLQLSVHVTTDPEPAKMVIAFVPRRDSAAKHKAINRLKQNSVTRTDVLKCNPTGHWDSVEICTENNTRRMIRQRLNETTYRHK